MIARQRTIPSIRAVRRGVAVIAAAVAASMLVACSSDSGSTASATTPSATSTGDGGTATAAVGGTASDPGASATAAPVTGEQVELLNVSYDPTRELYAEYADLFKEHYLFQTGVEVTVNNSHGGSGSQARAIVDGLEADVATLALSGDTDRVMDAGLIEEGWQSEFPLNSSPYSSTIVFLVRQGNPKGIQDWDDLANEEVGVITPNPKTSGGARWNFLAAWAYVLENDGTEDDAKDLLGRIYENVLVLDSGARGSAQTFIDRNIGDVLIAWENEALLATRDSDAYEIVYPSLSILAEPAVAVVDENVERHGTREVATEFLNYLYDPAIQEVIAQHFYRPSDPEVLAQFRDQYPDLELVDIAYFDGWAAVQEKFFADGAIFDEIYQP